MPGTHQTRPGRKSQPGGGATALAEAATRAHAGPADGGTQPANGPPVDPRQSREPAATKGPTPAEDLGAAQPGAAAGGQRKSATERVANAGADEDFGTSSDGSPKYFGVGDGGMNISAQGPSQEGSFDQSGDSDANSWHQAAAVARQAGGDALHSDSQDGGGGDVDSEGESPGSHGKHSQEGGTAGGVARLPPVTEVPLRLLTTQCCCRASRNEAGWRWSSCTPPPQEAALAC